MPDISDAAHSVVFTLDALSERPGGFLEASGVVTRTGVFEYANPAAENGVSYVLRHPDDVFAADSLATLERAPVTLGHPASNAVTAATAKRDAIGSVSGTHADGPYVRAKLTIWDADAIEAIRRGVRELSCGYRCDLAVVSGEYDGEPYSFRQINIFYNHLAVVERGRAGPDARLTLDGADVNRQEAAMGKIKVEDEEFEVPDKVADFVEDMKKRMEDAAKTKADAADVPKLRAELEAERGRADGASAALADAKSELAEAKKAADDLKAQMVDYAASPAGRAEIKARTEALAVASKLLGDEATAKLEGEPTAAIQRAVVASRQAVADDASAEYVSGAFSIIADAAASDDGLSAQRRTINDGGKAPAVTDAVADARNRHVAGLGWRPEKGA